MVIALLDLLPLVALPPPPLSGTLWAEESVVLGAEEALPVDVVTTLTVASTIEIVELIA